MVMMFDPSRGYLPLCLFNFTRHLAKTQTTYHRLQHFGDLREQLGEQVDVARGLLQMQHHNPATPYCLQKPKPLVLRDTLVSFYQIVENFKKRKEAADIDSLKTCFFESNTKKMKCTNTPDQDLLYDPFNRHVRDSLHAEIASKIQRRHGIEQHLHHPYDLKQVSARAPPRVRSTLQYLSWVKTCLEQQFQCQRQSPHQRRLSRSGPPMQIEGKRFP